MTSDTITPYMKRTDTTPERMAEFWGEDWAIFKGPLECPHCHADLRDHENGPPFKREIGIDINDRIAYWRCPDCSQNFERNQPTPGSFRTSNIVVQS